MKKTLILLMAFMYCFLSSCFTSSPKQSVAYIDVPESTSIELLEAKQQEECFTYKLSSDETYYIITGISDFGKALFDLNQSKIYTNSLSKLIFSQGWSQSNNMGFDVTIPSKYNNKPVKELGPDSLSYLSYYSYHLTIPESITTIGTNAIGCSYSSMLTQKEELQINGTYSNTVVIENNKLVITNGGYRDVFAPASIKWNVGEEELNISPYAFHLSMFYNRPYEVFTDSKNYFPYLSMPFYRPVNFEILLSENNSMYTLDNTILYNKDKTKVYFGYDFSIWLDEENNFVIPDSIEEIKDGSFALSSFTTSCNKIKIGPNLKSLSTYFFDHSTYCFTTISGIEVSNENNSFVWDNNMLMNKDKTKLFFASFDNPIDLPSTVLEVGSLVFCKKGNISLDNLSLNIIPSYSSKLKVNDLIYNCSLISTKESSFNENNWAPHGITYKTSCFDWEENPDELQFTQEKIDQLNSILIKYETITVTKKYSTYYYLLTDDFTITKVEEVTK